MRERHLAGALLILALAGCVSERNLGDRPDGGDAAAPDGATEAPPPDAAPDAPDAAEPPPDLPSEPACVPSAAGDPTCDGVDDDCDGTLDEDRPASCGVATRALGRTWSWEYPRIPLRDLRTAVAFGPDDLWIGGTQALVLHDDGRRWSMRDAGIGDTEAVSLHAAGPEAIWARPPYVTLRAPP